MGVFVNPSIDEIRNKLEIFDFDTIQLGNEDQNFISEIKSKFKKRYINQYPQKILTTGLIDVDQFSSKETPQIRCLVETIQLDWSDLKI